jgi:hypothetical protein
MIGSPAPACNPEQVEGGGWCVQINWLNGTSEEVGAFGSKDEAERWIREKFEDWLKDYENRRPEWTRGN